MNRGDLTDAQWERLQPLLPPQRHQRRVPQHQSSSDYQRHSLDPSTGAPWEDLLVRYGKRSTVSTRYYRWNEQGIWEYIYDAVKAQADARGELDWEVHHVDATVIRAHQHAAGTKKGTLKPWLWGAAKEASVPRFI